MGLPAAIGPYAVVRELGRGGMGVVYEVRHPRSPRPLALKMLLHADERSTAYERFTREAIALARVRHPNVVGVLTYDRAPDGPYLVTELVEGTSLRALAVPLEPRRAAQVVRALADALVAVHAAGVVHRDLKPENAILRPDGTPVLLDFGLAREHEARTLTEEGTLLGTPAYMAPEQLGDGRSVDARVDVYGLGAVLLFLLTGAPPFAGSHLEVLTRVLRAEPGWPKGAPPGLLAVLRRAMAKERDARHPSAAALRDDLDRWLAGGAPSGPGRARGCLALLGLLAALAVVSGAWVAARVGAEPGRAGGEAPVGTAPVVSAPPAAVRSAPPDEQDEPDEPDEVQAAAVGSAGRWTPRAAGPHPRYDIQHAMSWDPRREVVWLFGGLYKDVESATVFADLWSWDGEGWKEHATTGERGVPEGRFSHVALVDTARDRLVVYGGAVDPSCAPAAEGMWELDLGTLRWRFHPPSGRKGPGRRRWSAAAYSPDRGQLLLFGGDGPNGGRAGGLWGWDGRDWRSLAPPDVGPAGRAHAAAAYDVAGRTFYLYGGRERGGAFPTELWSWDGAWRRGPAPGAEGPLGREGHLLVHDGERLLLVGGHVGNKGEPETLYDDAWALDGDAWRRIACKETPGLRAFLGGAPDLRRGRLVVFGGARWSWGAVDVLQGGAWTLTVRRPSGGR